MTRQSSGHSQALSSLTTRPALGKILLLVGIFILAACSEGLGEVPFAFSTAVAADGPPHTKVRGILAPRVPESERTRVMILGTAHLAVIQERFDPQMLDGVVRVLKAFDPDLITIETQRPTDLAEMEAAGGAEDEAILAFFARTFINAGHGVRERMGVTWLEAFERQEALLAVAEAGESLSPADRLELAAQSLAAYDYFTALLQWSYLEPDQREAGQWIPEEVATGLTERLESANEVVSVAGQTGSSREKR